MNKKGFTLIELLAVIVILAIIALIATPIVLNIINDARESSNKQSIESLVRAAELYHASNVMKEEFPKVISLPDKDNILNLENAENMEGYISISKRGEIEVNVKINGEKYAKNYNNSKVYNKEKEEYVYEGNPDEWGVSQSNPSVLFNWKPINYPTGTFSILEYYMWLPWYYYCETEEDFPKYVNKVKKQDTIDETIKEFEKVYEGYEYYIPKQIQKEFEIVVKKLKEKYGLSITDELIKTYEEIDAYIETFKDEIPLIYEYSYGENFDLLLSEQGVDITITIPSKVNGIEIKEITRCNSESGVDFNECFNYWSEGHNYYNLVIPEGVEKINNAFFRGQRVYTLKLPSTIKSIGENAFLENYIRKLDLPKSITMIGGYAFKNNQIQKLLLPENLVYIGIQAFANNQISGKLTIPDSVTTIENGAFLNNQITELILSKNLTTIESEAFLSNQISGKLIIPDSVTAIKIRAFANNQIKEVIIPESVTTIAIAAFNGNPIEKITIEGDATRFNDNWERIGFPAELMPTE